MDFMKRYDVAIAGAGIAGVAAALAAARRGRKVAVIEKQTLIGGLATSGLIYIFLPLCDGYGTQVTFGIAEEMLRACTEFGPFDVSQRWGGPAERIRTRLDRFEIEFSPAGFTLVLDEMLERAGVDLWLDSRVCAVRMDQRRIAAIEVENSSGRGVVEADCFIDATGEALLIRRAGGAVETEINHHTPWIMEMAPDSSFYHIRESLHVQSFAFRKEEFASGAGLDGRQVTDFARLGWKGLREFYRENYASGKSDKYRHFPVHLPAMAQFRKIAAIRAATMLDSGDGNRRFDDSIGMAADWRVPGPVWETPFGTLLPETVDGVLAAGRCNGAIHDAWEIYRVIPAAAMTGEAAGITAALAVEQNTIPRRVAPGAVQEALRINGVRLHLDEVGLRYGCVRSPEDTGA